MNDPIYNVSIVMATYNGSLYIREQLDSILHQTYPIFEIIIQDDCSTDSTWEILQEYKERYSIIRLDRNSKNLKAHNTFKIAIRKATGNYIAPSDQDDIWEPNKIETLINTIDNKLMVYSQSQVLYSNNDRQGSFELYNPYITFEKLVFDNPFLGHALMFHQSLLPLFSKNQNQYISYDHMVALYCVYKDSYAITNKQLQIWRRHENVCTQSVKYSENNSVSLPLPSYHKFFHTMKMLLQGKKSLAISKAYEARAEFLTTIREEKDTHYKHLKILIRLTHSISKQTFFSYFYASILCMILRTSLVEPLADRNLKKMLASYFFVFRHPFVYWYDVHALECL
jgi:glycosyltransferase involved in cell wall biosynthesis